MEGGRTVPLDAIDLQRIARSGGSLNVSPLKDRLDATDLQRIASATKEGAGTLVISDTKGLDATDLQRIVQAAPGRVIINP